MKPFIAGQVMDFESDNETETESICADPEKGMSEYEVTDDENTNHNTSMFCIRFLIICFCSDVCGGIFVC